MPSSPATRSELRRLSRSLSLAWAAAWIAGIGLLATVAIRLGGRLEQQDFDARLGLHAMAVYGLTWFDGDGRLHDEVLQRENELMQSGLDLWVVEPGSPPRVHLQPPEPLIGLGGLAGIATRTVADETRVFEDIVRAGRPALRVHAIPTYLEDADEAAHAAILIVGDATPARIAQQQFTLRIVFVAGALGLVGLGVGVLLCRLSLRPVTAALDQRERFIAAAAHELRSPVAALQAVCDSARAGDEPAEVALRRMAALVERTGLVVDDLLLYARLDAGGNTLNRQSLRLDLLVETCLPEDSRVTVEADGPVIVSADERLVATAVRILLDNARRHGGVSDEDIRVSVGPTGVTVEDAGPGFPGAVLEQSRTAFAQLPSSSGVGLGLAVARMIAELHGGALLLENRREGGARVQLSLGSGA